MSEAKSTITEMLLKHEGLALTPYRCTAGYLTIGVGRNLDTKGLTPEEALMLLKNDVEECVTDLKRLFQRFDILPEAVQNVLIDMRFNLGPSGFRRFQRLIDAIDSMDYGRAADEMERSRWYGQVGTRSMYLVKLMRQEIK